MRTQQANGNKVAAKMGERRKLRRFNEQLPLIMAACDTKTKPPEIISFKARTIDVSLGGMRLEGPHSLTAGSIVGFELDDDLSPHGLTGVGEVKWCRPQQGSDRFEFGIAFPDYDATHGMREHLRL